jgi:hypothetical protein
MPYMPHFSEQVHYSSTGIKELPPILNESWVSDDLPGVINESRVRPLEDSETL